MNNCKGNAVLADLVTWVVLEPDEETSRDLSGLRPTITTGQTNSSTQTTVFFPTSPFHFYHFLSSTHCHHSPTMLKMAATEHNLDLSQPLAVLLKEATKEPHKRAETSSGDKLLLGGQLPKKQYIQFLMMLWHVYEWVIFLGPKTFNFVAINTSRS